MSPLDDARRLERDPPVTDDLACYYCGRPVKNTLARPGEPHAPDCLWLSMPKIVTVLAAAERVAEMWQHDLDRRGNESVSADSRLGHLAPVFEAVRAIHVALRGKQA